MPPFIVPNTIQVRLGWQMGGTTDLVSVLHAVVPPGFDVDAAVAGMATDVTNVWASSAIGPLLHVDTDLLSMQLIDIRSDTIREATSVLSGCTGAMAAGQLLPRDTQLCVTLRTGRRGRSFRGRVYIPGWGEIANDAGRVTSAAMTAAASFVGNLRAAWTARDAVLAVCSRKLLQSNPVTSVVVRDDRWDTLRGRDR